MIEIKNKETKSERINLHLTPTAKSIIADKASALDMNMTAYITACAVVKDVYVIGDKDTFNELVYQVKKIGSNINQLRMLSQLGRIECVILVNALMNWIISAKLSTQSYERQTNGNNKFLKAKR